MPENPQWQQIYRVASLIPAGQVASYGQVADLAGLPGRARLVAKVLKAADASQHLPWHRILRASGHIAIQGQQGEQQRLRLVSEGVVVEGMRVKMSKYQWQPSLYLMLHELSG